MVSPIWVSIDDMGLIEAAECKNDHQEKVDFHRQDATEFAIFCDFIIAIFPQLDLNPFNKCNTLKVFGKMLHSRPSLGR